MFLHRKLSAGLGTVALTATLLGVPVGEATAETSSWATRTEAPPPAASPSKQKSRTTVRPQEIGPRGGRLPAGALPGATPEISRIQTGAIRAAARAHKVPATGDEAAEIAFSQGQFLTALSLAEAAAGEGRADAYTLVGRIYAEGLGVPRDEVGAARWFARGAELGDVEAQFILGVRFAEGIGVPKNKETAGELFEQAARTGHALANYNLALLFLSGVGKPENPRRAAMHLQYAAEKGVAAAQYDLATLYATGYGVEADAYEAARWMRRAAEQGMAEAEFEYAVMLLRGQGLNIDRPKAVQYLEGAAESGIAGAQNRLAHLMLEGILVKLDPVQGAKWRLIAKENGIADPGLDTIIAELPASERNKAAAAARDWRERRLVEIGQ